MDDTLARLKDISDEAIKAFGAWSNKKSDKELTQKAAACVHELRKVAARLEVELINAERAGQNTVSIPIPPHRAAMNRPAQQAPDAVEDSVPDAPPAPRKIKRLKTEPGDED